MLKLAYGFKDELQKEWFKILNDTTDKYKFINYGYRNYNLEIVDSNWNDKQFVSIDESNKIHGFMSFSINRTYNNISNIFSFSTHDSNMFLFSVDYKKFLQSMIEDYKPNKVSWTVMIGNPIEKSYDKFCLNNGGRIVGVQEREVMLKDGTWLDNKMYEIVLKK